MLTINIIIAQLSARFHENSVSIIPLSSINRSTRIVHCADCVMTRHIKLLRSVHDVFQAEHISLSTAR